MSRKTTWGWNKTVARYRWRRGFKVCRGRQTPARQTELTVLSYDITTSANRLYLLDRASEGNVSERTVRGSVAKRGSEKDGEDQRNCNFLNHHSSPSTRGHPGTQIPGIYTIRAKASLPTVS